MRWPRYVPVAERRRKAEGLIQKAAKGGKGLSPVVVTGRSIAESFWGKAWCNHLEQNSDFGNRLPRGRTYVRNGSVIDLKVVQGSVKAQVYGSRLYKTSLEIVPLSQSAWKDVIKECQGQVFSLIELLQGRFSEGVMKAVTEQSKGILPKNKEVTFSCSCPDWAYMCKHVAAVIYGVGNRLDQDPALLFTLRGVDPNDLLAAGVGASLSSAQQHAAFDDSELSDIFGIELDLPSKKKASRSKEKTASRPSKILKDVKTKKVGKRPPKEIPAQSEKLKKVRKPKINDLVKKLGIKNKDLLTKKPKKKVAATKSPVLKTEKTILRPATPAKPAKATKAIKITNKTTKKVPAIKTTSRPNKTK